MRRSAGTVDLENKITDPQVGFLQLSAFPVEPVGVAVGFQYPGNILQPVHSEPRTVECSEHISVPGSALFLPERDRPLVVRIRGLPALDPRVGDRRALLSLCSPHVDGVVLELLMQVVEKRLQVIHYARPPFPHGHGVAPEPLSVFPGQEVPDVPHSRSEIRPHWTGRKR